MFRKYPNLFSPKSLTVALYLRGRVLGFLPGDRLFLPRIFYASFSSSRQVPILYLKLNHYRFLLRPFQFIIHLSFIRRCASRATDSVIKCTTSRKDTTKWQEIKISNVWYVMSYNMLNGYQFFRQNLLPLCSQYKCHFVSFVAAAGIIVSSFASKQALGPIKQLIQWIWSPLAGG